MVVLETAAIIGIVGWSASPAINRLIGKVQSYAVKKYKWHKDLEEKLESVARFLVEMRGTVSLVETRRPDDPNMECWLSQLKDAIDDMDDFFDIPDYEITDKSNKQQYCSADDDESSSSSSSAAAAADEVRQNLEKLVKKLDDIRQSSRGLVQACMLAAPAGCSSSDTRRSSSSSRRPVTGPLLPQPEEEEPVIGYKEQYEMLKTLLLPVPEKEDGVQVFGIIGHGGMGKTTLAQKACNDPAVKARFELVIWASLYNKFGEADLLGEIWRSAALLGHGSVGDMSSMSFSSMQQALQKLVASKTYLLVLDDVCNDETATDLQRRETWRNVLAPFHFQQSGVGGCKPGSRVLLTTRAAICARQTVGVHRSRRIYLDGIDRDSFLRLLKRSASVTDDAPPPLLEEVLKTSALFSSSRSSSSSAAAAAWKGSPFSAKEMGLKLRNTSSIRKRWEDILRTDCHENVILSHVSCYQHLPPHLQYCFAFVSLFPNGFKFHAAMLVKMWVAHGFITGENAAAGDHSFFFLEDTITMEDTASGYFNDLVSRSFFQEIKSKKNKQGSTRVVTHYVVHEQIHSMIRSVSANYFRMVHADTNSTTFAAAAKSIPHTVRHLSVTNGGCLGCLLLHLKNKHTTLLKRLRTLLVHRDHSYGPAKPCAACARRRSSKKEQKDSSATGKDLLISELCGVRVLDLTGTDIAELPTEIGNLIHLRYLVLPDTLTKELPQEVSKLLHLQVLVRSTDPQTAAVLEDDGKKFNQPFTFYANKADLSQIAGMNSLRGELSITGLDDVLSKKDAAGKAELRKKKSVNKLNLVWDSNECKTSPQHHQDVLEAFQPHFGIRGLQIRRYHGISSPSWLLNNCLELLTQLELINCRMWVTLPAFGHLPRLNHLHIHEMNSVIQIDGSGPFKSLETLVLSAMKRLVQWTSAGATDSGFTVLKSVEIKDCLELQVLPPILQKTMDGRVIVIQGCPKLL